jgi:hypothetical protein
MAPRAEDSASCFDYQSEMTRNVMGGSVTVVVRTDELGRRRWRICMKRPRLLATGLVLALLVTMGACSADDPPPSADRRTTTTRATTTSSTTSTTAPKDGYVKAKVDPSLPRQDIDINLRYPASFTPEQVEVVQAWANYRHVFYVTVDPPDPDSELLSRVATPELLTIARDQRRKLRSSGIAGRVPKGGLSEIVLSVDLASGTAQLLTCEVDAVRQVNLESGAVVDDDVTTRLVLANFVATGDEWLAAPGEERRHWPGRLEQTCVDFS